MNGKPLYKLRYWQGRQQQPSRSGLCPAIIMCQTNTTVSLHVHAACHSTASSLNEWEASLQTQVLPRQGRQQQPFQVWTLSCYHHVPNQHHSITACTCSMSQHCSLNEWEASLQTQVLQGRADSNSPSRSGLCPAIIMCQTNTTVSLHAACHSTASSLNEWEASLQSQVLPRQGRQQQPFQVWTLSCYHHVPNQHHSITACSMSQHCKLIK